MPDLNFSLHAKQMQVFKSDARFKVVAAGRRAGKSYLSAVMLLIKALEEKNRFGIELKGKEVWYIAPTLNQGRDIIWGVLKEMGKGIIESTHENTSTITLVNGRTIKVKGSDRYDTLRGVSLSYVVMDEYASMKPEVWDMIVSPALADTRGEALFIGTPDGKNHFYELWAEAGTDLDDEWEAFHFNSLDNPLISPEELEKAKLRMSAEAFRQEFEASFDAAGGGAFKSEDIQYAEDSPEPGNVYITVDPAGFGTGDGMVKSNLKKLDETAIAVVEVSTKGWFVHDVIHGRWGIRETSLQIIRAAQKYKPVALGIEKGSLKNAIMPYLEDQMRRLGTYPNIVELTHGGKKKQERILWALQGRFQNGRIYFKKNGEYVKHVTSQLLDFPNPFVHDDCFPAETPVITRDGVKPIVDVTTDDYVLTRKGYRKVLKAWCKGNRDVITKFGVTATPDHKIYTPNRGWVTLDSLSYADTIVVATHTIGESPCEKQSSLMAEVTTDTQMRSKPRTESIIPPTTNLNQPQDSCTETSGNSITEKFLKDIISITKMGTSTTTPSKTSSAYQPSNIELNTEKCMSNSEEPKNDSPIWKISDHSLKSGTGAKLVGSGINNTLSDSLTVQTYPTNHAMSAESYSNQEYQSKQFAPENAKTTDRQESLEKNVPVYDLMVEGEHEFFAWGVLVHNCIDALAYIDQCSTTVYFEESFLVDEYAPLDLLAGY